MTFGFKEFKKANEKNYHLKNKFKNKNNLSNQ